MITVNLEKARDIGHTIRRNRRGFEFAPLDDQIQKQIPGTDPADVEAQRQAIRDKYATIQQDINAATTPDQIKTALRLDDPLP